MCPAGDRNRLRLELALPGWLGATGERWTRAVFPYQPARALRIRSPLAWAVTVFGGVPLWAQDENCEISTVDEMSSDNQLTVAMTTRMV